jgi:hypothetical protein
MVARLGLLEFDGLKVINMAVWRSAAVLRKFHSRCLYQAIYDSFDELDRQGDGTVPLDKIRGPNDDENTINSRLSPISRPESPNSSSSWWQFGLGANSRGSPLTRRTEMLVDEKYDLYQNDTETTPLFFSKP